MSARRLRLVGAALLALSLLLLLAMLLYQLPFVQDRLGWRISALRADIRYALSPPEQAVFTPNPTLAAVVNTTLAAMTPSPVPTATPGATALPTADLSPTVEPTALPASAILGGITHEYQKWNNCGPANLSMALSYWDWSGDQRPVAEYTKPNPRDKNVMPYEMTAYVEEHTDFDALYRVAGDLQLLKTFISAGFPVIIEKGYEGAGFEDWMGHYEVVSGYDDGAQQFIVQDSYIMADLPVSYAEMEQYWRHFNYTYIVIYPPEREQEVLAILGPDADEEANWQRAAQKASDEIISLSGRPQFFAWFNRGTSLVALQDYAGAANAYDEAYSIYAQLDP
ncbi:MAG: C39 family peptidase, partial [Anaerolineales bacterium]